jgi:hypothetical protein
MLLQEFIVQHRMEQIFNQEHIVFQRIIKHAIKIMALYATLQIKIGAKLIISKLILA